MGSTGRGVTYLRCWSGDLIRRSQSTVWRPDEGLRWANSSGLMLKLLIPSILFLNELRGKYKTFVTFIKMKNFLLQTNKLIQTCWLSRGVLRYNEEFTHNAVFNIMCSTWVDPRKSILDWLPASWWGAVCVLECVLSCNNAGRLWPQDGVRQQMSDTR